ncbi:alpha/beta hydrolase [Bifidobacterium vansinderenii]|uniref:Esterase n=1 Tax=Bifidobacterium vansinderenii TaxID=1984871 RepID=A0A229VZF7_9BIFI|nr:alpha/beta hydrolase-fold protein [Bifidobacterium vansinderenii]OXN01003.1 esterase [Bifidobacterium vansinderenii]
MSEEHNEVNNTIGRESTVVPGRFGEPFAIDDEHVLVSRGDGTAVRSRPLFLSLHGWGANEEDAEDLIQMVAPLSDYVALRGPYTLEKPKGAYIPGAYAWFHDNILSGDDLDYDVYAAAKAVDDWVTTHVPDDRDVVPLGFSQGGTIAVHLLRIHPERYRAAVSFSGYLAPGRVPGTAPADDRLTELDRPVYYCYGKKESVVPKYELYACAAWLEEHTWLNTKSYRNLDHAVNLDEFNDIRDWLITNDLASGIM